jgi:hypothetical protein
MPLIRHQNASAHTQESRGGGSRLHASFNQRVVYPVDFSSEAKRTGEPKRPFEPPHILELQPRVMTHAYREITRSWSGEHRLRVSGAMSALLGKGMKREIQREHPDWPTAKVNLEIGRLSWGWEIAPPLYGPLEEEARARGESPTRRAEFCRSWRLDPPDEPIVFGRTRTIRRTPEEITAALARFSAGPCG